MGYERNETPFKTSLKNHRKWREISTNGWFILKFTLKKFNFLFSFHTFKWIYTYYMHFTYINKYKGEKKNEINRKMKQTSKTEWYKKNQQSFFIYTKKCIQLIFYNEKKEEKSIKILRERNLCVKMLSY